MSDLVDRFRDLDRVPTPDLWDDARTRTPRGLIRPGRQRFAVMVMAGVVAAAGLTGIVIALLGGSKGSLAVAPTASATAPSPLPTAGETVRDSGLTGHGRYRCSATFSRMVRSGPLRTGLRSPGSCSDRAEQRSRR